jgi:4-alpha-glucanotransferase
VPPDYFSPTGQLWGNPLYRWAEVKKTGFQWWGDRMRATLRLVDIIRLDHFRGFQSYWAVPAGAPTAENGRWVKGPGAGLFRALRRALRGLPIIAEDLGTITPGMKVLQFAFSGDGDHKYLPHNYERTCVVYSGTHDNDTTRGWYARGATEREKDLYRRYAARDGGDVAWDFIRLAQASSADSAIVPLQDVLDLGSDARMNTPGQPMGNWAWRFRPEMLRPDIAQRLRIMTELFGRA